MTEDTSKKLPFYERITVNPFTSTQREFLEAKDLTGYRVTEKQEAIVKRLEDGITDIFHVLEQPKSVEYQRDDIEQIFNPATLYPIIHNLIRNFSYENKPVPYLSKYNYDFRRMEIIRMLFDELRDYIEHSPMFENDIHVLQNLYQISLKLKNSSETILKNDNLLIKQIRLELEKQITRKEVEKVRKELEEKKIQENEIKSKKKLSKEKKYKTKITDKQVKDILIEEKFMLLLWEMNKLDIKSSEHPFNAREQNINSLYFDLYKLDIERKELRKTLTKNELEKNRKKREHILKEIKRYREDDKELEIMIEKIGLTENEFNKIIEPILPYFSPLNPINRLQFILDTFHEAK